jgi:hypothetical protein
MFSSSYAYCLEVYEIDIHYRYSLINQNYSNSCNISIKMKEYFLKVLLPLLIFDIRSSNLSLTAIYKFPVWSTDICVLLRSKLIVADLGKMLLELYGSSNLHKLDHR